MGVSLYFWKHQVSYVKHTVQKIELLSHPLLISSVSCGPCLLALCGMTVKIHSSDGQENRLWTPICTDYPLVLLFEWYRKSENSQCCNPKLSNRWLSLRESQACLLGQDGAFPCADSLSVDHELETCPWLCKLLLLGEGQCIVWGNPPVKFLPRIKREYHEFIIIRERGG